MNKSILGNLYNPLSLWSACINYYVSLKSNTYNDIQLKSGSHCRSLLSWIYMQTQENSNLAMPEEHHSVSFWVRFSIWEAGDEQIWPTEPSRVQSEIVVLAWEGWNSSIRVNRALRAVRGTAAHPPQLPGEGPAPAARLTYTPKHMHQLSRLLPVRHSPAVATRASLLAHGGQHLADVGSQQVIHFVALIEKIREQDS